MINLLFCGNYKVFDGILTCLLSIFKRTETKEPFNVMIFTMDVHHLREDYTPVTDEQIAFLAETARSYNKDNIIKKIDVTEIYNKEFANSPNEQCYCSPYTLLRLFADLIPDMPDKVLYLDADLLFNKDIKLLYDIDVTNYEYAALPTITASSFCFGSASSLTPGSFCSISRNAGKQDFSASHAQR